MRFKHMTFMFRQHKHMKKIDCYCQIVAHEIDAHGAK
jgi:hypothetical protein